MNITRENTDNLNVTLIVKVEKGDYEEKVEKVLKDYRKKARIDGFRPGMVPPGLIRKLYRKPVMAEEINKVISEALYGYLSQEKLQVLGEPLPSESRQKPIDWENQEEFEFAFDLGLAPEFDLQVTGKDKVPFYDINIDKKMTDAYLEDIKRRYGSFEDEETANSESMLRVRLEQTDENSAPVPEGIQAEAVSVSLKTIKDEVVLKDFVGRKPGDSLLINIHRVFSSATELSAMLNIPKKKVAALAPHFLMTINEISRFTPAPVDPELFNSVYGEGQVSSEEEFMKRIEEDIRQNLNNESEQRFRIDAREKLIEKSGINLPADFLKRWLRKINEGKYSPEEIEHDFDHFEKDLKWQLISDRIVREHGIEVSSEEILDLAKQYTRSQFQRYGLGYLPDEEIEKYAGEMLKKEDDHKRLHNSKLEEKVFVFLRETVKLDRKKVNSEEFNALYEKHNH